MAIVVAYVRAVSPMSLAGDGHEIPGGVNAANLLEEATKLLELPDKLTVLLVLESRED